MKNRLQLIKQSIHKAFDVDYYSEIDTGNYTCKIVVVSDDFENESESESFIKIYKAVDPIDLNWVFFMPLSTKDFNKIIKKATFNGF